ncbi:MAG: ParA family protein [Planctomycetes bacterium]|nr:ParA family protein [Planctomycetota bacterium]
MNHKGGVGKTSTTVHLAGALAEMGYKILLFDCDSQGDLSAVFLRDHESLPHTIADIFTGTGIATTDLIQATAFDNIFIVPADNRLNEAEKTHGFEADQNVPCLADTVSEVQQEFDFILFDCPPRPHLSGFAAMVAANEVIVPCQPSQFSLRCMATLEDEIAIVNRSLNPHLSIRGYFLSMVGSRSKSQEVCFKMLTEALGEAKIFKSFIPLMPILDMAINLRRPIVYHSRRSKAAQVFRDFAQELIAVYAPSRATVAAA